MNTLFLIIKIIAILVFSMVVFKINIDLFGEKYSEIEKVMFIISGMSLLAIAIQGGTILLDFLLGKAPDSHKTMNKRHSKVVTYLGIVFLTVSGLFSYFMGYFEN